MTYRESLIRKIKLKREILRRRASSGSLIDFIRYNNSSYKPNWHHIAIANKIEQFIKDKDKKNLMLFIPPQFGKSEITSRNLPAYLLGINPNNRIVVASYSQDLAASFNRDIQRIIDTPTYSNIFPNTKINARNVVTTQNWLRNSEVFEVINYKGYVKAVGVGTGLTGRSADIAIIDDPVKDEMEASSPVYRENVWNWYLSVLMTRLHNGSKVILIMTRWHEDDLAGRLLNPELNPHYKDWEVIKYKAICEEINEGDPRKPGESLWPEMHSIEKLNILRDIDENKFNALFQQEPVIKGGNKVKSEWFTIVDNKPFNLVVDMWIDGAYTDKTKNDPTGIILTAYDQVQNKLYILGAIEKYYKMPDLLKEIPQIADTFKMNAGSRIYIEPKASGKTLKQLLSEYTNLAAIEINNHLVNEGKESRLNVASPYIEAGNVVMIRSSWNQKVINQIIAFPKGQHDEFVDLFGYACFHYFKPNRTRFWDISHSQKNLV